MSDDQRFDPRFDPSFQRGWDGPAPSTPAERPERPAVVPDRLVVTAEPEPDYERDGDARRLNPFLIALAVVAVALVATGLWTASVASSGFNEQGPTTQLDWAVLQMLMIGAPVCTLLGVATGVGILFLFAARWRRAD